MSFDYTAMKEVIKHLSDGQWHEIFSLHERFRLSPARIVEVFEWLNEKQMIDIENDSVKLSRITDKKILAEIRKYFLSSSAVIESFSDQCIDYKVDINEPYTPDVELIDKKFFAGLD